MDRVQLWHNLRGYDIVLASQSPRRVELLSGLGITFRQMVLPNIDESFPKDLAPLEVVRHICRNKSLAYREMLQPNSLIITADTIVVADGEILGKPTDKADAQRMLRLLSGREHSVITAVTLLGSKLHETFSDETQVSFASLSEEEIDYYIELCRPYDKAGAYGIQEWIGYRAIRRIEGSFYTVMGLPTEVLAEHLKAIDQYAG